MKISPKHYNIVKQAMAAVLPNMTESQLRCGLQDSPGSWLCYSLSVFQLRNDDSHPFFTSGRIKRIVPYNPEFNEYPEGINDTHIETAVKKIWKELRS